MPKALEDAEPSFAHTGGAGDSADEREQAQVRVLSQSLGHGISSHLFRKRCMSTYRFRRVAIGHSCGSLQNGRCTAVEGATGCGQADEPYAMVVAAGGRPCAWRRNAAAVMLIRRRAAGWPRFIW